MRCPYCGSFNTRRRYRRHRLRNRRCRDCGRTFRSRLFPVSGPFLALLILLAATGVSIYFIKPREPVELEALPRIPENVAALEWESHNLISQERIEAGLNPLQWDARLADIARDHSRDMAENNFFSHDNLKGDDPEARGLLKNYRCRKQLGGGRYSEGLGENILQGHISQSTSPLTKLRAWWNNQSAEDLELRERIKHQIREAQTAVENWMDSPGHRRNILDSGYDRAGMGVAFSGSEYHLTQNFC